jgi:hypothetical protein
MAGVLVRTRDEFIERAQSGWRRLSASANELATTAGEILSLYQDLSLSLTKPFPPLMSGAIEDMREQLTHLVPKDFILSTPRAWQPHDERFHRANQQRLKKITTDTLEHYNRRADSFWEGTKDHDVRQNIEALLRHIEGAPPFTILDFGCGPGRDLKAFSGLGHIPIVGELFKSRAFDSTKRELVIFVTPRIVNPDSDKIRTIIEDVKTRYKQARSEVNFNIFD